MILNITKPREWTSFDVVAKIRGILKEKHVGHAGTLDPLAEGVLLVLTGKDTKKQNELMQGDKEYLTEVTFGISTPTLDMEFVPELKSSPETLPALEKLEALILEKLPMFTGNITQEIPVYSAKKVDGKPLYKLARQNKEVAILPTKEVTIYSLIFHQMYIKEMTTDKGIVSLPTLVLGVVCSHGTFIRTLAKDLGLAVGLYSVMTRLVRTRVGDFRLEDSITIEDVAKMQSAKI